MVENDEVDDTGTRVPFTRPDDMSLEEYEDVVEQYENVEGMIQEHDDIHIVMNAKHMQLHQVQDKLAMLEENTTMTPSKRTKNTTKCRKKMSKLNNKLGGLEKQHDDVVREICEWTEKYEGVVGFPRVTAIRTNACLDDKQQGFTLEQAWIRRVGWSSNMAMVVEEMD